MALVLSALAGEPGIVSRLTAGLGQSPPFREALLTRLYFLKPPASGEMLVDQVVAEVTAALSASPNAEPTVLQTVTGVVKEGL